MKKFFEVKKIVAIFMVTAIATLVLAGCEKGGSRNDVSATASLAKESSAVVSVEESSKIESSTENSEEESSISTSKVESSVEESSEEEASLTEEEKEKIIGLIPELNEEKVRSMKPYSKDSIICYAKSLVREDFGAYNVGDIFRIIGKDKNYFVLYVSSSSFDLIKSEFVELLPLDYKIKDTDTVFGD